MTLDEAIKHAEELSRSDGPCAADHFQLAEWLRQLQDDNDVINDLRETLQIMLDVMLRRFRASCQESISTCTSMKARNDFLELLGAGMIGVLEDPDGSGKPAKNYVQVDLEYQGQRLGLVLQRHEGKTPIEIIKELTSERDELREKLARLEDGCHCACDRRDK